jgi:hypothetical protein
MRKVLIPMNVPNAFRECDEHRKDDTENINPKVDPFLVPLLTKLSLKRPTWTFVFGNLPNLDDNYTEYVYDNFTIMDGDEKLGCVCKDVKRYPTRVNRFLIDCSRLKERHNYKRPAYTKDINKAAKLILDNMYRMTAAEFVQKVGQNAYGSLKDKLWKYSREHDRVRYAALPALINFAINNPDLFKAQYPSMAHTLDELVKTNSDAVMADKLEKLINGEKVILLAERDGKIYMWRKGDTNSVTTCPINELSSHYKQAVGMLKLVENDTLIPDVGYRADSTVFLVFDGGPLDTV